ncbi:MAG: 2-amino-4-hydroxy-6-hydroxymethyldihydropteridine diphosphokinase [Candidatus Obscuribacter sp.]|nr:2-amino-4-hydroxy-6-hydroxymethyldihydropteridine diphosphokinase [Candidatus Obscuribacter sp.]MBL0188511.1 2-amino-4-hydroxy-6-hydroxymethyldihydropteridine diphosphokinase [Candidatus Obscuribacter sp.]MBP6348972.1 2-amino-4-hydroxy-6-hydroxymethyldihydropteridine diphosphokinase [Candidatus Obscuribacter sp.]MBP6591744.1 2-amino-4-hydroxy-6-hydroxymethyldihydropteridine diphosphokinase [Candidatus Obscuribacter sp.]MBP7576795.1 2-amino-4-hydroxy-6-hydroxymethyldihydropteridine diphosphok
MDTDLASQRKLRGNKRRVKAYIGIGSNEGERLGNVQQALQLLKDVSGIKVLETSSLYETEPIGDVYTQWFVNAVVSIETEFTPFELLDILSDIENRLLAIHKGNSNARVKERVMDLDILFYGDEILDSPNLKVPHPRLLQRAFALVPLLEIAPEIRYPGIRKSVAEIHEELAEPEQVVLYGTRTADP